MMLGCKFIVTMLSQYLFRLHSQITMTSTDFMVITTLSAASVRFV